MLNIIIEGPDRAGKTTLAAAMGEMLAEDGKVRVTLFHNGVHADPFSEYLDQLLVAIKNPDRNHIWDRFWPSNLVYSPIAGGKMLTAEQTTLIRNMSMHINCFVVLCLPPWEEVKARWEANLANEYIKEEDKMHEVYNFYSSGSFSIGQTIVDPFVVPADQILDRIARHVKWTE